MHFHMHPSHHPLSLSFSPSFPLSSPHLLHLPPVGHRRAQALFRDPEKLRVLPRPHPQHLGVLRDLLLRRWLQLVQQRGIAVHRVGADAARGAAEGGELDGADGGARSWDIRVGEVGEGGLAGAVLGVGIEAAGGAERQDVVAGDGEVGSVWGGRGGEGEVELPRRHSMGPRVGTVCGVGGRRRER